ncbi:MAG: hypothetical protein Q7S82_02910 [bacterium]|nr:hypothetical protein [bacterium]
MIKIDLPEGFHLRQGFHINDDPHFVYLWYGENKVAVFSAAGASPAEIQKEAEKYLRKIRAK